MTVGASATGKTTCLDSLKYALEGMGQKIDLFKLNPKSITKEELFGCNDLFTNTFTHGIVSKIITQAL